MPMYPTKINIFWRRWTSPINKTKLAVLKEDSHRTRICAKQQERYEESYLHRFGIVCVPFRRFLCHGVSPLRLFVCRVFREIKRPTFFLCRFSADPPVEILTPNVRLQRNLRGNRITHTRVPQCQSNWISGYCDSFSLSSPGIDRCYRWHHHPIDDPCRSLYRSRWVLRNDRESKSVTREKGGSVLYVKTIDR